MTANAPVNLCRDERETMKKKTATKKRATRQQVAPVVRVPYAPMATKAFWTVVWNTDGRPVSPLDRNPGSPDEGMLVYRTRKAAQLAAKHQTDSYGDGAIAIAVPLTTII